MQRGYSMNAHSIPSLVIQLRVAEYKTLAKLAEEEEKYVNNYLMSFRDPKTGIRVRFELVKEPVAEDDSDSVVEAGGEDPRISERFHECPKWVGLHGEDGELLAKRDLSDLGDMAPGDTLSFDWKLVIGSWPRDEEKSDDDV
jgi:hypothetical protein